jgi:O-antigen/teichoic acid export membrane protein
MPDDFALATNYMVLSGLFNALIGLSGYTYFGANFFSDYKKEQLLLDIFVLNLIITLISLILVAAFHGYLETVFKLSLIWQLMALFTGLFLHFIEMTITFLRFDSKLRVYSLYQISNAIISTLLTVIFVIVLNWTWQGRIYSLLITPLVFGFSGIYILKITFNFQMPQFLGVKQFFKFGFPLLPHKLSNWLSNAVEKILLTRFVGLFDMGIFSFTQILISALSIVSESLLSAISPEIYKKLSKADNTNDSSEKANIINKTYQLILAAFLSLFLIYPIFYFFIKLFVNEKYHNSIVFLPFFLSAFFFGICYNLTSIYIFHSKNVKFFGLLSLSVALSGVLLNVLFIKIFGTIGAAYTAVIISFIKFISTFIYSNRVYPMPWFNFIKTK